MRVFARTSVRLSALFSASVLLCSLSAQASTTIAVANASFENLTQAHTSGKLSQSGNPTSQDATNWTNAGYNFVFSSDSAKKANGDYTSISNSIGLWGTNLNSTSNGIGSSPDGGNFLAMDGAYGVGSISQVLTGLTVGMTTKVSFYYAGAQQYSYDGTTTEAFTVSLGSESHSTAILSDASHGFTGWSLANIYFTPTATTETLSFLAAGTPDGVPPFSLLDGISVVQVTPEPSSLALLGTGVLALGGLLRRRRSSL